MDADLVVRFGRGEAGVAGEADGSKADDSKAEGANAERPSTSVDKAFITLVLMLVSASLGMIMMVLVMITGERYDNRDVRCDVLQSQAQIASQIATRALCPLF